VAEGDAPTAREVRKLLGNAARTRRVTLLLPAHQVLRPKVELPAAAAENLAEVLAFEMDRFTPFPAEDVLFDFRVKGTDPEMERLTVDLVVARQADVSAAMLGARTMGLDPNRVAPPQAPAGFNLLPPERRRRGGRVLPSLIGAATVATLVLGAAAVWLDYQRKQQTLEIYEARLARLRAETGEAGRMQAQVSDLLKLSNTLVERKRAQPPMVEVLNDATRRLPDDHYLISFAVRKGTVQMAGYSGDPSSLLRLVEDSDLFSGARFAAPVTMDPRVGEERFNMIADIAREAPK